MASATDATPIAMGPLHELLRSLGSVGAAAEDADHLLERVVDQAMRMTSANGAVIEQVDGDDLVYVQAGGSVAPFAGLRLPRGTSLSGWCVSQAAIQRCDDTETDHRVNREACRRIGIRSMLVVPLFYGSEVVGVLKTCSDRVAAFNEQHVHVLELAGGIVAAVIGRQVRIERHEASQAQERASHEAERTWLRQAALIDDLTELPNRRAFEMAIDEVAGRPKDEQARTALLFIDINRFKQINDTLGHRVGDKALQCLASVLRAAVRPPDVLARLAGDEFVVLLHDLAAPELEVAAFCNGLTRQMETPQPLAEGITLTLSISIGVALHSSGKLSSSEWLHRADQAMYDAKSRGGGFAIHGR